MDELICILRGPHLSQPQQSSPPFHFSHCLLRSHPESCYHPELLPLECHFLPPSPSTLSFLLSSSSITGLPWTRNPSPLCLALTPFPSLPSCSYHQPPGTLSSLSHISSPKIYSSKLNPKISLLVEVALTQKIIQLRGRIAPQTF